ncbi:MAG: glycogen/starch synthase [Bacteroidetes bacterium]|nr:glycogen/starch synthase [Pseudopedobacter sp.]MBU1371882.1 glycogen/starch synthase [Bacteroidota bacterium]MBU1483233.1 glycogen/starch synthase [Bacteroidota bacterium]MBU1759414.1 glycogen/starch synthase [Bacteroidota bacterium]MBU2268815.1 glycogen/starch synthase [Bacteroidota bacterium]
MGKTKLLFITHEMSPFLELTKISKITRQLPQVMQEKGFEIRILMPRFGNINERRNRLHEVIRLSGMNIIIDETDNPLIIKVASIPAARMQVYFLDNEDYFHRKYVFNDAKGKFYADNDERAIFFCKGALETVKKLGWAPDIVHCHGWMSSLIPAYLKTNYKDDPTFKDSKVVYSIYNNSFSNSLGDSFIKKALIKGMKEKDIEEYQEATHLALNKAAIKYTDGIVIGDDQVDEELLNFVKKSEKAVLDYESTLDLENYYNFYQEIASDVLVSVA